MAADTRLLSFVESALRDGATPDDITTTLADAGWDASEISIAVGSFAGIKFNTPVPRKRSSLLARDFAFYLFLFATLYVATFSFINLGFDILDYRLKNIDPNDAAYIASNIRYWSAMCLVFVPAFMAMAWQAELRKRADPAGPAGPAGPMSPSRQWLTYLTLLLAGLTALGDLVALVDGILSGEASLLFYLQVLFVGVIAGSVLFYYARDIRDVETKLNAN